MVVDPERVRLMVWISREAKEGLEAWTRLHGATVTAQIEAAGLWCAEQLRTGAPVESTDPQVAEITARAVQVAKKRRRRREDTPPHGIERRRIGSPPVDE